MNSIKKLEFNNAVVIESADGSEKYIGKYIKGNKIEENTNIQIIGGKDENEYIFDSIMIFTSKYGKNIYRVINSNETIFIEIS